MVLSLWKPFMAFENWKWVPQNVRETTICCDRCGSHLKQNSCSVGLFLLFFYLMSVVSSFSFRSVDFQKHVRHGNGIHMAIIIYPLLIYQVPWLVLCIQISFDLLNQPWKVNRFMFYSMSWGLELLHTFCRVKWLLRDSWNSNPSFDKPRTFSTLL